MAIKFDIEPYVKKVGTQQKFADLTGLHRNTISYLCRGVKTVELRTLAMILKAFPGLEPNDLFVIEE
jgi:DNA-binding transcriptional regulator YdaS (Cro superfamily)